MLMVSPASALVSVDVEADRRRRGVDLQVYTFLVVA